MSRHHPDDVTLLDYSAGTLALPESLAVATHLSLCDKCSTQLGRLNAVGGALLEDSQPRGVTIKDFDSLMAEIDSVEQSSDSAPIEVKGTTNTGFRNPLEKYLPESLDELDWDKQTGEISVFDLTERLGVSGYKVALQKIKAGARVPHHTHKGHETTVVLSGGFSDGMGVYHEGDFVSLDGSHRHSPTALQNEDCICLTVLDAPLHFTGLYRFLNLFMKW